MDSVNSTTFIKRPPHITPINESLLYTKEILSRRIFLGCYQERRYVSVLKEYRDVVILHFEETELHNDLDKIRKKWLAISDIKWLGITGPEFDDQPKVYCFWVKLSNLPFGNYWFQIKHVKFTDIEVFLQLKCIRKTISKTLLTSKTLIARNEIPVSSTVQESSFNFDSKTALKSIQSSWKEIINIIHPYLTWKNFVTVVKVVTALTISIIFGCISTIPSIGEFILKLIRELSYLIQAFSPIIIQLIDFITKVAGGIFILLARLFGKNPFHVDYNSKNYQNTKFSNNRAISSRNDVDWRERNKVLRQELLGNKLKN